VDWIGLDLRSGKEGAYLRHGEGRERASFCHSSLGTSDEVKRENARGMPEPFLSLS
jgi:hypothetical protein